MRTKKIGLLAAAVVTSTALSLIGTVNADAAVTTTPAASKSGKAAPGGGTAKTLILYDTTGDYGWMGEVYATQTANLSSHFGSWTAEPVANYQAGDLGAFTAVIYLGSTYDERCRPRSWTTSRPPPSRSPGSSTTSGSSRPATRSSRRTGASPAVRSTSPRCPRSVTRAAS